LTPSAIWPAAEPARSRPREPSRCVGADASDHADGAGPLPASTLDGRGGLVHARRDDTVSNDSGWSRRDTALLIALWAVITALNMLWVSLDQRPPHWDKANHLANSLVLYDSFSPARALDWLETYTYYPPFAYWVTDLFYAVIQRVDVWVAVLSQSTFLAVLILATYGIGSTLWSNRVGLLSALFVVTTPMLVSSFKDYMLDAPLMAMTTLALYLLIRAESFSIRRYAILFGLVCGAGLLTKWSFVLAMALPTALAGFLALRVAVSTRTWTRLVNLGAAGLVAIVVSAPWYLHNLSSLSRDASYYNTATATGKVGPSEVASLQSLVWYAWNAVSNQLFLVPFLLFLAGLILLLRRPGAVRANLFPLLLIVGTYVSFTFVANKDPRYTMPLLPGIAVVATYWITGLQARLRSAVVGVVVAYGAFTFLVMSFGTSLLPREVFIKLPPSPLVIGLPSFSAAGDTLTVYGLRIWSQQGYPLGQPSPDRWYQEEMFKEAASQSGAHALWFQGPNVDTIWFNSLAMRYFSERYSVVLVAKPEYASVAAIRTLAGQRAIAPDGFVEVSSYSLPDGGALRIYRRKFA
jgi:4-amino-4-deoxy-L-arabinose transferase-like glycosyltransferase